MKKIDFYDFSNYDVLSEKLCAHSTSECKEKLAEMFGLSMRELETVAKAMRDIYAQEDLEEEYYIN